MGVNSALNSDFIQGLIASLAAAFGYLAFQLFDMPVHLPPSIGGDDARGRSGLMTRPGLLADGEMGVAYIRRVVRTRLVPHVIPDTHVGVIRPRRVRNLIEVIGH